MTTASSDQPVLPRDSPAARPPEGGAPSSDGVVPPSLADADARQEHDVWLGSYAGRTMLPSLLLCGLLTLGVVAGTWSWYLLFGKGNVMRYTAYGLVGPVWLLQLSRWLYRVTGINYRLTSRRLFRLRGFLYPPDEAVQLADVTQVAVVQTPWECRFHIGTIRLLREREGLPPMLLEGVRQPDRVAAEIRHWAQKARGEITI